MNPQANVAPERPVAKEAPNRAARVQQASTGRKEGSSKAASSGDAGDGRSKLVQSSIVAGQYTLAVVITLAIVIKLYCVTHLGLKLPYSYDGGDTMLIQAWCKSVIDHGWHLHNANLGAPDIQYMEDFPQCDALNYLVVKFFALFSHNPAVVINLFSFSSYVLVTLSALLTLRCFKIAYPVALVCSLLYSFLPYHFGRLNGHHFLAFYQVVPLSVLLVMWIYLGRLPWRAKHQDDHDEAGGSLPWRWTAAVVIALLQSSAGVYYAFFAMYFLVVAGVAAALQRRKWQPLLATVLLVTLTFSGVMGNLAPSFFYWKAHGRNTTVGTRVPAETEYYGFKLSAMLLPIPGHRAAPLADLRDGYEKQTPIRSESTWSSQGIVANIGFLVLLGLLLYRRPTSRLLEGLSVLNVFGILFATVGGLGMIFSLLITPQIRSQNRISVYLSFFSIICVAVLLQALWNRFATTTSANGHLMDAWPVCAFLACGIKIRSASGPTMCGSRKNIPKMRRSCRRSKPRCLPTR